MDRSTESTSEIEALDAFERLLRDHARVMASAIRKVCGRRNQALVPDVQQEVYLALWKRLQGKAGKIQHPVSYVYKVALTTALAQIRRLDRAEPTDLEEVETHVKSHEPFGRLEPAERARLVQQVLQRLDEDPRRAVKAYLAGFNHTEIAELYGWSASRARHLVYRSLDALRRSAVGATPGRRSPRREHPEEETSP